MWRSFGTRPYINRSRAGLLPEYLRGLVRPIHGGNRDGEHLEPLTRLRRAVEVGKMAFDGARDEWLKYLLCI